MANTKRQHFVPRIYLKAWETQVETKREPDQKFEGVYVFNDNASIGEGANPGSILCSNNLYTVKFKYSFIGNSCPKIYTDFVNKIYELMRNNSPQKVYAKVDSHKISTKKSIRNNLSTIEDWRFYYDDGNVAREKGIRNQIDNLHSYILEEGFDDCYEKRWESIYTNFIKSVKLAIPMVNGDRAVAPDIVKELLEFFFMMLCRNPGFEKMSIYEDVKEKVLYPSFERLFLEIENAESEEEKVNLKEEAHEYVDMHMKAIWYSELYKVLWKHEGGYFNSILPRVMKNCQMVLYETVEGEGSFITSDNPAIEFISSITAENTNGLIFPITPKFLLHIGKGDSQINIVRHYFADADVIKHFNRIIHSQKRRTVVANVKHLNSVL